MTAILIQRGRLIDPAQGVNDVVDVLIESGRVIRIAKNIKLEDSDDVAMINASGKLVVPGLIDIHVHLRQPGFEYKENIESGLRAAIKGGFTSVCPMPNTNPVSDTRPDMEFLLRESRRLGLINLWPVGAVTIRQEGKRLTEFGELKNGGAVALSDDGYPIRSTEILRRALEYAKKFELPIMLHEEEIDLSQKGNINEGVVATRLGLLGSPCQAESAMVARDIEIASLTDGKVHFQHISCGRSVELIRHGILSGVQISAETCPHYLFLTEESVLHYNTNAKMYPPLRTSADVSSLRDGISDGTISIVGTDHAPHANYEKDVEFDQAPNGIVGLETALPLMLKLVKEKVINIEQLVQLMSVNPSELIGIKRGTLEVGSIADVTILDPEVSWNYDESSSESKSKNSPFWGQNMIGRATHCLVGGRLRLAEGNIIDKGNYDTRLGRDSDKVQEVQL